MPKRRDIERKFMITALPRGFDKLRGTAINEGYLAQDPAREIRVRQRKGKYFLVIREGEGFPGPVDFISITKEQFDQLWPLTKGHRVERSCYSLPHKHARLELNIYSGNLAPLRIVVVGFDSEEAEKKFVPPPWLGEEITGKPQYQNLALAYYGLPDRSNRDYRIGAMPYLLRDGRIHLVLITNSSGTKWIVPKGQPEKNMTMHEVAMMEAVEEAGVIGTVQARIRGRCTMRDDRTLYLFPLRISTVLQKWPETSYRQRAILPVKEALERLTERPLAQCVARLAARLEK